MRSGGAWEVPAAGVRRQDGARPSATGETEGCGDVGSISSASKPRQLTV